MSLHASPDVPRPPSPVPPLFRHVYVHVPFCARRCTYCDFSIAVRAVTPVDVFLAALTAELELRGRPDELHTLYLGGGTPSRLGGEGIAQIGRLFGAEKGLGEFTIEANPEDITDEAVTAWVRAGVNRLSIGSQSFDDRVLAWMHRTHDASAIGRAVEIARRGGIERLSLDLIFSLPESMERDWDEDLRRAIDLDPGHISLYGLTIEPHTPLAKQMKRGAVPPAPDTRYADEYLRAHERLGAAGYRFYEVSNASKPGQEAIHNRAYWRRVPYLGLGPSAHSFDGTTRWWNERAWSKWLEILREDGDPIAERETLTEEQRRLEELYLGLRTIEGLALWQGAPARLLQAVERWVSEGWAEVVVSGEHANAQRVARLTPQGWLRLDVLVASV